MIISTQGFVCLTNVLRPEDAMYYWRQELSHPNRTINNQSKSIYKNRGYAEH